jgi:cytochrome c553
MIQTTGRRLIVRTVVICGVLLAAAAASAQTKATAPDLAKGQQIAATICAACHGADGNSTATIYPKLAGQHEDYLFAQLTNFAKPATDKTARVNAIMLGMASALSSEDRRNVAAYFASQKPKPGEAHNRATLVDGQRIFRVGIPEKAVPACAGCHGPTGAGIPVQYPRIGGQHQEYAEAQLKAFRDGVRNNNQTMMQIAARLSDPEIKAVTDFIDGLH